MLDTGGTVTLLVDMDLCEAGTTDREFVLELIDKLHEYSNLSPDK